ncbi:MAG: DUF3035 domain-containing protein [Sphingomicrobium sp.]
MRKASTALILIGAATLVSGCAVLRGSGKAAPDEFAVTRNAPLVVPPDFHLTPPVAGTAALSTGDAQQQAIETLFGPPAPRSPSETSLLEVAGRDQAQLGIRSVVADPGTRMVDKGAATLTIIAAPVADSDIASAQPGQ